MQQRLRAAILVLLIALAGVGVSLWTEHEHQRISNDPSYVSFCNINNTFNCEVVLSSHYSTLLGVSVSLWATLYYIGLVVLAVATVVSDSYAKRRSMATMIFGLSVFGLLFSLYMALVAITSLNTICPMCFVLYLVSISLFLAAWRFRAPLVRSNNRREAANNTSDRWVVWGSLISASVLIAFALWEALGTPAAAVSADEIKSTQPDFYKWYFEKPVVTVASDVGNSHGAANAPITIVEFSDFGCGHCAAFDRTLEQVLRAGRHEQVRLVYRHFPLDSECNPAMETAAHPHACLAAIAAECAAEQGKFWPYHKVLFENQNRFKRSELLEYAEQTDIDMQKFEACLQSDAARERVTRDATEGKQLQIQSTPTWFINGRKIEGALDPQRLADAITLALSSPR